MYPRMTLSGVRSSCDMVARKSDFSRLACSSWPTRRAFSSASEASWAMPRAMRSWREPKVVRVSPARHLDTDDLRAPQQCNRQHVGELVGSAELGRQQVAVQFGQLGQRVAVVGESQPPLQHGRRNLDGADDLPAFRRFAEAGHRHERALFLAQHQRVADVGLEHLGGDAAQAVEQDRKVDRGDQLVRDAGERGGDQRLFVLPALIVGGLEGASELTCNRFAEADLFGVERTGRVATDHQRAEMVIM